MKCPKCNSAMEVVTFQNIEVNRCSKCNGIWFDEFELQDLRVLKGSEIIDKGDALLGKQYNKVDQISCPKCEGSGKMIRMVDPKQSHIWFECCKVCGGAYFDASEFKDLKQQTISDFFRNLFTKERVKKP